VVLTGIYTLARPADDPLQGDVVKAKTILMGGLLALPGLAPAQSAEPAHTHGEVASPAVQAALEDAKARVPRPRWEAIHEKRIAIGRRSAQADTLIELDDALNQTVVVVLDANGTPHSECVEGAPPREPDR
jgi:hypothetical protein